MLLLLATSFAPWPGSGAGAQLASQVSVVGHNNLGGQGFNTQVAVVGNTAVVGAGQLSGGGIHTNFYNPLPCPAQTVKIVDLSNPANPVVSATIPVAAGVAAPDVDAIRVSTPSFTGDLAAIALALCGGAGGSQNRGVVYYDITNRSQPVFLGRYFADFEDFNPNLPPCGQPGGNINCAQSEHEVALVQRPDGRVLSVSTQPGATASNFDAGDMRLVDVTNPRNPVQLGTFPPGGSIGIFSPNGCRPFRAGHSAEFAAGGNRALLPYYDDPGLFHLDITNPSTPTELGRWRYPPERRVEGNAAYATEAGTPQRPLALVSEEDWIKPESSLLVRVPVVGLAGLKFGCEAMFTLFDPEDRAQIYRHPHSMILADIVYVGFGCPGQPLLANPAGKIALADRGGPCGFAPKVLNLQNAGAVGVVFAQTNPEEAFSPDGDPTGLEIPAMMIDRSAASALKLYLCPRAGCVDQPPANVAMIDRPGEWGALQIIDLSNPTNPVRTGTYRTPRSRIFPPPDLGVYSVHHAVAVGERAYAAWNSDGLRVLRLTGGTAQEIGFFVPPDTPDPRGVLPAKALVQGVDTFGCRVVITDVHTGLYVLNVPPAPGC